MSESPFDTHPLVLKMLDDPLQEVQDQLVRRTRDFGREAERLEGLLNCLKQISDGEGEETEERELPRAADYTNEASSLHQSMATAAEQLTRAKLAVQGPGLWACQQHGISWSDQRAGDGYVNQSDRRCHCGQRLMLAGAQDLAYSIVAPAIQALDRLCRINDQLQSSIEQAGVEIPETEIPPGATDWRSSRP